MYTLYANFWSNEEKAKLANHDLILFGTLTLCCLIGCTSLLYLKNDKALTLIWCTAYTYFYSMIAIKAYNNRLDCD